MCCGGMITLNKILYVKLVYFNNKEDNVYKINLIQNKLIKKTLIQIYVFVNLFFNALHK